MKFTSTFSDIVNTLKQFDFAILLETWCLEKDQHLVTGVLDTHTCLTLNAVKLSKYGRASGGIAVYIKNSLVNYVERICESFPYAIVLKMSTLLTCTGEDIILLCTYLPPEGSPRYAEETNGVEILKEKIIELKSLFPNSALVIIGDLNARIGGEQDFILDDSADFVQGGDWYISDTFSTIKESKDHTVNTFGRSLLSLCYEQNIHTLNGRGTEDKFGEYTYVSSAGASVIDYIIVSSEISDLFDSFKVMELDFSDHFPVSAKMKVKDINATVHQAPELKSLSQPQKFRWDANQCISFNNLLEDEISTGLWSQFVRLAQRNVDQAESLFVSIFHRAAKSMALKPKIRVTEQNRTQPSWWDEECFESKNLKNTLLNNFRKSNCSADREAYCAAKKAFRSLCKTKKRLEQEATKQKLVENVNDAKKFWKTVKSMRGPVKTPVHIPSSHWIEHFQTVLNQDVCIEEDFKQEVNVSNTEHETHCNLCDEQTPNCLNATITHEEITNCISSMAQGKAAGEDGIVIEMLKASAIRTVPYLHLLFNQVLDSGHYPENWSKAMLCPIHKKGSKLNVDNYRGISLLSVVSKLFTKILNQRFVRWAEDSDINNEEQAGYRKGYSTIDQMFNLQSLVQKHICKQKGRCFVLMVDFSKAFDTIPHELLWYKLRKTGVHGKILKVLQNMYSKLKSCVRTPEGLTEYFKCTRGTRQGCMLSPFLFVIYISELVKMLKDAGCSGIQVNDTSDVMLLMFADDIAMCADTPGRLQKMLDTLALFCRKWGLKVNLMKTKIIVFRRGGIVKSTEKWFYNGEVVECVNHYKYLGLFFTSKLSWSLAKKTLASQAGKALNSLYLCNAKCGGIPSKIYFDMFDKMILPILLYGADIWGFKYSEKIEQVQVKFCKRLLGLTSVASNEAALGEVGRYPLAIHYHTRCIKYWLKVLNMTTDRYPRNCYNMLYSLDQSGKHTWASCIREMLEQFGFRYVWNQQGVGDIPLFLEVFKSRVKEYYSRSWFGAVRNCSKLALYTTFKYVLEPERYLDVLYIRKYLVAFARFRCSNHVLEIERGRHLGIEMAERVCKLCVGETVLEDEYHFLMHCVAYKELRAKYIEPHILPNISLYDNFVLLMQSGDVIVQDVACFIYKALCLRQEMIKSVKSS